jgi:hypothetical protein
MWRGSCWEFVEDQVTWLAPLGLQWQQCHSPPFTQNLAPHKRLFYLLAYLTWFSGVTSFPDKDIKAQSGAKPAQDPHRPEAVTGILTNPGSLPGGWPLESPPISTPQTTQHHVKGIIFDLDTLFSYSCVKCEHMHLYRRLLFLLIYNIQYKLNQCACYVNTGSRQAWRPLPVPKPLWMGILEWPQAVLACREAHPDSALRLQKAVSPCQDSLHTGLLHPGPPHLLLQPVVYGLAWFPPWGRSWFYYWLGCSLGLWPMNCMVIRQMFRTCFWLWL